MNVVTVCRGIIQLEDTIFVVQNKGFKKNDWCLPGGKSESHETPVETMKRELTEETAVNARVGRLEVVHQLFTHDRNGDEVQRIEFFFRIDNPEDFADAALHNTTHGELEMNDMGFRRLREINILPGFLADFLNDGGLGQKSETMFFEPRLTMSDLHSDQGSEYLSSRHQLLCDRLEIRLSASGRGKPWQNGFMERWFGGHKLEVGDINRLKDIAELHEAIALRIYYYNTRRIHTALRMSPTAYAASLVRLPALKRKDRVLQKVRG